MLGMLPAGAASAFALVGLGAGSGAVAALSPTLLPVAEPLLLVATALVAVSHLRCSPLAVASATAGGALLYLGMYAITERDGRAAPPCSIRAWRSSSQLLDPDPAAAPEPLPVAGDPPLGWPTSARRPRSATRSCPVAPRATASPSCSRVAASRDPSSGPRLARRHREVEQEHAERKSRPALRTGPSEPCSWWPGSSASSTRPSSSTTSRP